MPIQAKVMVKSTSTIHSIGVVPPIESTWYISLTA